MSLEEFRLSAEQETAARVALSSAAMRLVDAKLVTSDWQDKMSNRHGHIRPPSIPDVSWKFHYPSDGGTEYGAKLRTVFGTRAPIMTDENTWRPHELTSDEVSKVLQDSSDTDVKNGSYKLGMDVLYKRSTIERCDLEEELQEDLGQLIGNLSAEWNTADIDAYFHVLASHRASEKSSDGHVLAFANPPKLAEALSKVHAGKLRAWTSRDAQGDINRLELEEVWDLGEHPLVLGSWSEPEQPDDACEISRIKVSIGFSIHVNEASESETSLEELGKLQLGAKRSGSPLDDH